MIDALNEIIRQTIPDANQNEQEWKSVIEQSNSPSFFHLFNTVNYYVAYYSNNSSINLSLVLHNNKEAVGIMPLMVHINTDLKWILTSNGVEIVEPIFIPTLARKVKKRLEYQLEELVYILSNKLNIKSCQFTNIQYGKLSSWYLKWIARANEVFSTHHLLVDLSLPIEEIKLHFRKSFKPLVTKGLREWKVEVHKNISHKTFEKFRSLHKEVSGVNTRPIESWLVQKQQIQLSESFLITVSETDGDMIGAGLFTFSHYQGLYCVGAYKRELFDKPIGHAVQMMAIKTLKDNNIKWYEIGQRHFEVDKYPATEKELSISHFKEGFATEVVAKQHLIVKL